MTLQLRNFITEMGHPPRRPLHRDQDPPHTLSANHKGIFHAEILTDTFLHCCRAFLVPLAASVYVDFLGGSFMI